MMMKVAGVLVILLAVVCGAFYWYFNWSQNEIKILNENNAKLEAVVENYEVEKKTREEEFNKQTKKLDALNTTVSEIRQRNSDLEKLFAEHDFHKLTKKKPGLIENRVNDGTKKLFEELEELTDPASYLEQ